MDFYISNNLTKSEFKAHLYRRADSAAFESVGDGYPSMNFSFRKNTLSFLFFMASAKEAEHIANLEFYFCKRPDPYTALLENHARSEAYKVVFKNEECSLTFVNVLNNYLKLRGLKRGQFE